MQLQLEALLRRTLTGLQLDPAYFMALGRHSQTTFPVSASNSINELSRHFLIAFTLELDRYAADGQTSDTTSSFLSWVKMNKATLPP
ncbi:hypothetical protein [Mesorhizobium sp.]|uniref:hypothetical protein n=1 Tax=Mesorhizobium sp. TaxID=1871066 RepID=UPI000FE3C5C0|nr:hypothetical protein [Mesorhizobium sp.]RWH67341.1 MAG: hypothetical protein EOQ84_29420 [Mesorhizobium sp.]RWL23328.1 MAG: hypothetical protein EOR58_27060 [Mesorhizobium sp.]RWL25936.1 MAG: hypothetical protein EOR63_26185 [Mesorhizobium sp.]RWL32752.1 MAG: hypothetical protein EOR59_26160 [Mesorhizobium sp.]RWL52296.1 MAG: hypothetical protein EOR62_18645 [Mesorhizobium sp.]